MEERSRRYLWAIFFSALGRGTSQSVKAQRRQYLKQKLNYLGPSLATRYLAAVLPKHLYGENESTFSAVLQFCADSMSEMTLHGVTSPRGIKHHMVLLRVCGDWPFLMKAGSLQRGFNRGTKSEDSESKAGICHLCRAGQQGLPYEQINTANPAWLRTVNTESPFNQIPEMSTVPHDQSMPAQLYEPDAWHCWHLGVGKRFMASCLSLCVQQFEGSSLDKKYKALTAHFLDWCRCNHYRPYISKIQKSTLAQENTRSFPVGHWSKGMTTTVLCLWLEAFCEQHPPQEGELLAIAFPAVKAINRTFEAMYREDFWIPSTRAIRIANDGLEFLRLYYSLACQALQEGKALFSLVPKIHLLHHTFVTGLLIPARSSSLVVNPLAWGCQISEDFIGRPSRTARRVSPRLTVSRTLSRHLRASYAVWVSEGFLTSPQ